MGLKNCDCSICSDISFDNFPILRTRLLILGTPITSLKHHKKPVLTRWVQHGNIPCCDACITT